jgi:chemotaxis methyl-accepting protein methylase
MGSMPLERLAEQIEEYSGISIAAENSFSFRRAAEKVFEKNGISPGASAPGEAVMNEIIDLLIIHETFLFREAAYLPYLLSLASESERPLKILSLGVSTGEEAYSIAAYMLEQGCAQKIELHGADISRRSIDRAASGVFDDFSLRKTDEKFKKYFTRQGDGTVIADEKIKRMITFSVYNLLGEKSVFPRAYFDVVSARNLFIYFGRRLNDALDAAAALLCSGGYLVTTPVEFGKIKNFGTLRGDINLVSK